MERATRLLVLASVLAAGVMHAWLVNWQPALATTAALTFVASLVLARVSTTAALLPALLAMQIAPALLYVSFGSADHNLTLVWLAALAGPLFARAELARWHLPQPWVVPFVAWAVLLALSWPIVAARELDFSLVAARTYDTTNVIFGAPPRVAAAWIVFVALAQMLGILWIDFLYARFTRATLSAFERSVILPVVIGAAAGALAGVYQGTLDINWMNTGIWPNQRRAGGLMLDANTFGVGVAMWAPAAVVLGWCLGWSGWIGGLLYALLGAGMWFAGSRTALLTFSVGTAGLLIAIAKRRGLWQARLAPILALLGAGVLILAMAIAPRGGNSPNPIQRVFDRLPRLEAAELNRFVDEMWTRFGYGSAASEIVAEHPVTGIGIGAFHVLAGDYVYRSTGRVLRPDNAQNWWRHQVAELGVLGSLPSLWLSWLIIVRLWRGGIDYGPLGSTTVLRTVLIGIGLASMLGVPTQLPAAWLSFVTLLFWMDVRLGEDDARPTPRAFWWPLVLALGVSTAAGVAVSATGPLRVPYRAARAGVPYAYGVTPPEGLSEVGELRWIRSRAVAVMRVEHLWLQLTMWPSPAAGREPERARVWLNGRRVLEQPFHDVQPVTFFLQMPGDKAWITLEFSVLDALDDEHALRIAHQWLRELPPDAAAERVIR